MKQVLIIDDDASVLGYLNRLVQRLDYKTITAASCDEAREKIISTDVGIIISDLYLPGSEPIVEWVDELITLADSRPLILITGESTEQLTTQVNKSGVTTCLTKPFELTFIKSLLQEHANWAE